MKSKRIKEKDIAEEFLTPYLNDRAVCSMNDYIQHGTTTTLQHCLAVTSASCGLAQRLHLRVNYENLALGALLHDFYLYDWHGHPRNGQPMHGFIHPLIACQNASVRFHINAEVQHIIRTHMWPLTLRSMPASPEAVIVCLVDKYISTLETIVGLAHALCRIRQKERT